MQDVFVFRFPLPPVSTAAYLDGFIRPADDRPREFPARPLDGIPPPDRFRTDIRDDKQGPIEVKEMPSNGLFTPWLRRACPARSFCMILYTVLRPVLASPAREQTPPFPDISLSFCACGIAVCVPGNPAVDLV